MRRALILIALAGCGADRYPNGPDANNATDAPNGTCTVSISIKPDPPEAGDHVHAIATATGVAGVPSYAWTLDGVPTMAYEAPDNSAIGFDVPTATSHVLTVEVGDTTSFCAQAQLTVNVMDATGMTALYRLRVVPPAGVAPPSESSILVHGGTSLTRDVPLDPGMELAGTVTSGATAVPAYLKFTPTLGPSFDAFSAMTGAFDVQIALQPYTVLVVPELAGLAPRQFAWTPGVTSFDVDAGQTVTGTVLAPGGGPLANAQVQLSSGGVPSTIATTAANGTFTVQMFVSGAQVTVSVVPPATSGLARLAATAAFDLAQSVQVAFAAVATCDLAGDAVKRGGVAQPGASVTVVGAIAGSVGTVTAGVAASATGTVLVAATTTGAGALPSMLVPRSSALSAVVAVAPGDLAVAALDTSACSAQTIVAPAQVASSGVVSATINGVATPLGGVRLEATPVGTLALATLVPVDVTTAADGSFLLPLASGGLYDVRVSDGSGHGAPLLYANVTGVPAAIALGAALTIGGTVSVLGGASTVEAAAVEVLCNACTGVDADRPIAQGATDIQGQYQLTIADPGAM